MPAHPIIPRSIPVETEPPVRRDEPVGIIIRPGPVVQPWLSLRAALASARS